MAIRKDSYLKKLNNSNLEIPTPITREEKILSELAGVNGLGIELPAITSQDDGKVLKVSNGAWTLGESGEGGSGGEGEDNEFVVTIDASGENLIADKTFNEIFEAKQADKLVSMVYYGKKNHVIITSGDRGMPDGVASVFLGELSAGWDSYIPVVIVKISDSDQVTETYKSLAYTS